MTPRPSICLFDSHFHPWMPVTDKKDVFCNLLMNALTHLLPENLHGLNLKLFLILIEIWYVCLTLIKKKKKKKRVGTPHVNSCNLRTIDPKHHICLSICYVFYFFWKVIVLLMVLFFTLGSLTVVQGKSNRYVDIDKESRL